MNRLNPAWIPGNTQHPILVQPALAPECMDERTRQKEAMYAAVQRRAEQDPAQEQRIRQRGSQITFYPYDRGQCYDKTTQAVMAFVNVPGAAAHYAWSSQTRVWEFVQLPHMSSEQRCAERMGYGSVDKMRRELFKLFDGWLGKDGMGVEMPEPTLTDELLATAETLQALHQEEVAKGVPASERQWPWSFAGLKKLLDLGRDKVPMAGLSGKDVAEALGEGR